MDPAQSRRDVRSQLRLEEVEALLARGFVDAEGTSLRREERKKAVETHALLLELERLVAGRKRPLSLVDAAAGKGYVGLLAAKLLLAPRALSFSVHAIERNESRVAASMHAARLFELGERFRASAAEVDAEALPEAPTIVVGLHACGEASDAIIDASIARRAKHVLLVPCCTSRGARAVELCERVELDYGLPTQGGVRKRLRETLVLSERVLRLEAAGYATEVVDFVPARVTPYNVLLRARSVDEPVRRARAEASLARLREAR